MTKAFQHTSENLTVWQLRALSDNYIYILTSNEATDVVAIDPSEAGPVFEFLSEKKLRLSAIWNTHHHHDHVGGNLELQKEFDCRVYCSEYDRPRVPGVTDTLAEGDELNLGPATFTIMNVPGHTLGAIAFYSPGEKMVFTGDTLFTMGCGRLFEGSFEQMFTSLGRLKALPDDTAMYCGHEYTRQNTAFAQAVRQDDSSSEKSKILAQLDAQLDEKRKHTEALLAQGQPTVPGRMGEEKVLNPFLTAPNLAAFSDLRRRKDQFRLET